MWWFEDFLQKKDIHFLTITSLKCQINLKIKIREKAQFLITCIEINKIVIN